MNPAINYIAINFFIYIVLNLFAYTKWIFFSKKKSIWLNKIKTRLICTHKKKQRRLVNESFSLYHTQKSGKSKCHWFFPPVNAGEKKRTREKSMYQSFAAIICHKWNCNLVVNESELKGRDWFCISSDVRDWFQCLSNGDRIKFRLHS